MVAQELSKAYKTLREYESILNIMPDIIYKIDPEGRFVYLSNSVTRLGFQPEELLGKHFSVFVHPDDVLNISRKYVLPQFRGKATGDEKAPKLFDEVRTGRRITKNLPIRLIPKFARQDVISDDVPIVEGEVIASGIYGKLAHAQDKEFEGTSGRIALKNDGGAIAESYGGQIADSAKLDGSDIPRPQGFEGTVGFIRDITEQKQLQDRKQQLEQQLFHSNKMQTIGELAGGIAHDFNNLLSIMLGQTEMILNKSASLEHFLTDSVITIQKTILQAADLNSKLLTFARKVKVADLPVALHELIEDTINLLFHSFDKRITIQKNLTDGPSLIIGDAGLLKNAFINIALNARDAMIEGGDLVFETAIVDQETVATRFPGRNVQTGDYIALMIKDTGIGMDQDVLDRIFEPFFTTKSLGKGTGLGLACVDGIVEMHKGLVDVQSAKGTGSTFRLYFPLAEKSTVSQAPKDSEYQIPQKTREHILIVDDEPIVLETQSLLLLELGYRVTSFSEAYEAIEYFTSHHEEVDLVILDLNMPNLNGKQCYLSLKDIRPDVRVIISTGCNVENEADELFKVGISGLIQKPFPIKKLGETIRNVLLKHAEAERVEF
jgi:PAS domain S-box-containing protein